MAPTLAECVSDGHLLEQSVGLSETIGHVDSWLQNDAESPMQTQCHQMDLEAPRDSIRPFLAVAGVVLSSPEASKRTIPEVSFRVLEHSTSPFLKLLSLPYLSDSDHPEVTADPPCERPC